MTSIIKLSVISGARDESPPCYLLQVDDFTFLLDCGWNGQATEEMLEPLTKYRYIVVFLELSPRSFRFYAVA